MILSGFFVMIFDLFIQFGVRICAQFRTWYHFMIDLDLFSSISGLKSPQIDHIWPILVLNRIQKFEFDVFCDFFVIFYVFLDFIDCLKCDFARKFALNRFNWSFWSISSWNRVKNEKNWFFQVFLGFFSVFFDFIGWNWLKNDHFKFEFDQILG